MGFIGNILKAIVGVGMILAVVAVGVFIFLNSSFSLNLGESGTSAEGPKGEKVMFTVEPGQTIEEIGENLKKQGLIDSPLAFRLQVELGSDVTLKAGQHQLTRGMPVDELIAQLSTSPVEKGITFQVIEGMRLEEIADKLSKEGIVDRDNFLRLAQTPEGAATFQSEFMATSGRPADQGLEGYLFPDTYEIKQTGPDNSEAVIRKMLSTLEEKFTPEMKQAMAERKVNVHQVLTIASITEREGQVPDELPLISAVYWNRFNQDIGLYADPTTQYAVGEPGNWWPDLDEKGIKPGEVDNPYNTYVVGDLPPGPICNSGLGAIQAAVFPAQTDYLYFVAKGDGTHLFARTLEEHNRNSATVGR